MNDPDSRVAKMKAEKLNYGLLAELNTRPRTTYLARLRNPNPEIRSLSHGRGETNPRRGVTARPVIAPGYTFGTVTDQIASVVLTRKTPLFWFAASASDSRCCWCSCGR